LREVSVCTFPRVRVTIPAEVLADKRFQSVYASASLRLFVKWSLTTCPVHTCTALWRFLTE